jgi:predicted RNase H-like HicB family nuclease
MPQLLAILNVNYDDAGNVTSLEANLHGFTFKEGDTWISYCKELDISSSGATKKEAENGIREAIELFFDSCVARGALDRALTELGWVCRQADDSIISLRECRDVKTPFKGIPAFQLKRMQRQGKDWSRALQINL